MVSSVRGQVTAAIGHPRWPFATALVIVLSEVSFSLHLAKATCFPHLTAASSLTFCPFRFSMPSAPGHPLIVTIHAVDSLTRFRKNELLYRLATGATGEARGVVGLFARHDGFFHDGEATYLTRVVALRTDRMPIGEK